MPRHDADAPDWKSLRERFLGLDESSSVKSYYPQLKARVQELEDSRSYLEQKSAALVNLLEDLEEERRHARESEAQLQAVFRNLPFAFWTADAGGRIVLANELARQRYGMEKGFVLLELPLPDAPDDPLLSGFEAALEGSAELRERVFLEAEGERWVQSLSAPIVVEGRVAGVLGADLDMTRHRRAEDALAKLNSELETKVAERTRRLEAAVLELRDAQERIVNSEKLAALGRLTAGIAHDLNSPLGAIESSSLSLTDCVRSSAGLLASLFADLGPDISADFLPFLSRCMDGASQLNDGGDRKRRRALARDLEGSGWEAAESIADAVDELGAYDAYASFRTSYGLEAASRMVLAAASTCSLVRSASIVGYASERAAAVVRALKSFEEDDAAEMESVDRSESDFDRSLESALDLFRGKLRRGVSVDSRLRSGAVVRGDRASLGQVWVNLISNALAAMEYRGTLELRTRREEGFAVAEIIDSGCGIPESLKGRVFDPFFTTKAVGEGSGFGLAVAKRTVERFGGTISFESAPGRTVFRVALPLWHPGKPEGETK